ncbi:MAG: SgcJ/EcaC family oxidoreductase, partial [Vicinamibacteria bacterium]
MKRFAFFAGALALAGCQPAAPPPDETTETAPMTDEDMLRARTDEFEQAVSSADPKAIGALFIEDGDLVDQAGMMHHGRMAIEERYQKLFDGPYKGTQANLEISSVRFVRPE